MPGYLSLITYYLENMLSGIVIALLLYLCLFRWRMRRLKRLCLESGRIREVLMAFFWMFCGGMAVLTLTPRGFHWIVWLKYGVLSDQGTFFALGDVNLHLFNSIESWNTYTIVGFLGNILMFAPFGAFFALLWRNFSRKRCIVLALCITVCTECWQILVGRAFDIDDLLLNTLGILCGYGLWRSVRGRGVYCKQAGSET